MRALADGMKASLEGPATTLARAWRLTRADGRVLGFTDHDEALLLDGTRFEAATGLAAGEAETTLGLSAGTQEVEGALFAEAIGEADIAAGLYDGARVESFVVDWAQPERHFRLSVSTVGEIRRTGEAFTAELRGPEAALDAERGRTYRRRCDADLGDARCGVDLAAGGLLRTGTVVVADGAAIVMGGLGDLDPALYERGRLTFADGRNAGASREIAGFEAGGGGGGAVRLSRAPPPPHAAAPGGRVRLRAGCDRSFATCRARFANTVNFRGFPHLPGLDAVLSVAKRDDLHDGSVLVS